MKNNIVWGAFGVILIAVLILPKEVNTLKTAIVKKIAMSRFLNATDSDAYKNAVGRPYVPPVALETPAQKQHHRNTGTETTSAR